MKGLCGFILWTAVIVAGVFGMAAMGNAQSAVHEIEALICFLIMTVAAGAGLIAAKIDELKPKAQPVAKKEAA